MNRQERRLIEMSERTEPCELTTLVLIRDGNRILLQERNKGDGWNGLVMPGGHVEPGESFVECARREVREETGLEVGDLQLAAVKQFPHHGHRYIVMLYCTDCFSGTLRDSEEGHNAWYDLDDLPREKLVFDFDKMLETFLDPSISEFQYIETADGLQAILR